jgi:hypothetical protein
MFYFLEEYWGFALNCEGICFWGNWVLLFFWVVGGNPRRVVEEGGPFSVWGNLN